MILLEKTCTKCGETKPREQFPQRRKKGDGYEAHCKTCHNAAAKRWRTANLERAREIQRRGALKFKYGLSVDEWDALFKSQDEACAICKTPDSRGHGWHVDHDHKCCAGDRSCGQCIRGILCTGCNVALGQMRDDTAALQAAIDYLNRSDAS